MSLLIKHKIWGGFTVIICLMLVITGVSILNLSNTDKTVNSVVIDSQPILTAAQNFSTHISKAHTAIGDFLITKIDKKRQAFQNEMYEASENLKIMSELPIVARTPDFQEHVVSFRQAISEYEPYGEEIFKLSQDRAKNRPAWAFATGKINPLATDFLSLVGQMILSENENEDEENADRVEWLNHMHEVRYNMVKLMSDIRMYMQTPEPFILQNMLSQAESMGSITHKMSNELFVDLYTFEQEEGVPMAIDMIKTYRSHIDHLIELNSSAKRSLDIYLYTEKMTPVEVNLQDELDELIGYLLAENQQKSGDLIHQVHLAKSIQFVLAAVALVIGAIVAFVMGRVVTTPLVKTVAALQSLAQGEGDLTQRLGVKGKDEIAQLSQAFNEFAQKVQSLVSDVSDNAMQLVQSASQMDASANSTQSDILNQNGKIEQVAQAIEVMDLKIQDVVSHTNSAANLAEEANNNAAEGQQVVNQSVVSSQQLAQNVDRASQVINELESDVDAIGGVLDVIRGIAEQTNLLALNAAIEAARAGDQGRGFAVVADEVRTLASRTGQSTDEIQKMIERLQNGSRQAVQVMQQGKSKADEGLGLATQAGESLDSISLTIQSMLEMNREIASGTEQQGQSANKVSQNIISIKGISNQTELSAKTMASASNDVMQLAQQLQGLLGQFKI